MELVLQRKQYSPLSTCGELHIDGKFQCYTLERPHPDIKGAQTPFCIPAGTYAVKLRWSEHFQRQLPGIEDVPGRTDIEMHVGNYPKDVKGCIVVGQILGIDSVGHSSLAFEGLMRVLQGAGESQISITIT